VETLFYDYIDAYDFVLYIAELQDAFFFAIG